MKGPGVGWPLLFKFQALFPFPCDLGDLCGILELRENFVGKEPQIQATRVIVSFLVSTVRKETR